MENAKYILQNNASWTSNCDSKVSYILTVNSVILTIILTSENSKFLYQTLKYTPDLCIKFTSVFNFIEFISLLVFLFGLLVSFYFAYMALKARVNPGDFSDDHELNNSNIFWATIATKKFIDYKNTILSIDDSTLKADLINQVYVTSKICTLKFKRYNRSLLFTAVAYIALIIYVIIKIKNPS